uniref:Uncharacterized protein n=1 Tax=Trichuris muris TaxID=70415 RepID=A0A5S6QY05_TRIMR
MFELTGSNWTWCYRILSATLSSIVVVSFLCSASLNRLCSGWLLQFTGWRHLPEREKDGSMNYETKDRFFGRFIVGVRDFLFVACVYACEWFPLRLAMPIADQRSFDLEGPKRSKDQFDWKFKLLTADYCHFWWSRTKALFNKRNGRFQADERLPINSFHLHGNDHRLNAQRRRFAPAYVKLRGKFFSQVCRQSALACAIRNRPIEECLSEPTSISRRDLKATDQRVRAKPTTRHYSTSDGTFISQATVSALSSADFSEYIKQTLPLRSVVSSVNSVTSKLCSYQKDIIKPT